MNLATMFSKKANPKYLSEVLEEGVEKIVQYGNKTLKVMKPKMQEWTHFEGGLQVHKSFEDYYINAGFKPIGHSISSVKDVLVTSGASTDRLVITNVRGIDGYNNGACKVLNHVKNYGKENVYQNCMTRYPSGRFTFNRGSNMTIYK